MIQKVKRKNRENEDKNHCVHCYQNNKIFIMGDCFDNILKGFVL